MRSRKKRAGKTVFWFCIILLFVAAGAGAFRIQYLQKKDKQTNDSYEKILNDETKKQMVAVHGIKPVEKEISDETACVEMLAAWKKKHVTEEVIKELDDGTFMTSSDYLLEQMNRYLSEYETVCYKDLKNSKMLEMIYESLRDGMPVLVNLAMQKTENRNTYNCVVAIVVGMNLKSEEVNIINPNGCKESFTVDEFLKRTRCEYKKMDSITNISLIAGLMNKNTVYFVENKQ